MTKVFVTSDHHFFHEGVIENWGRPFKDVESMHHVLVNNWNKVVSKRDRVFHLGDFSLGDRELTKSIVASLNGYKVLILGNKDRSRSREWWLDVGFDEVIQFPIVYEGLLLSHEPIETVKGTKLVNLHGHTHNKSRGIEYINMCVEQWDYTPANFDDVVLLQGRCVLTQLEQ